MSVCPSSMVDGKFYCESHKPKCKFGEYDLILFASSSSKKTASKTHCKSTKQCCPEIEIQCYLLQTHTLNNQSIIRTTQSDHSYRIQRRQRDKVEIHETRGPCARASVTNAAESDAIRKSSRRQSGTPDPEMPGLSTVLTKI